MRQCIKYFRVMTVLLVVWGGFTASAIGKTADPLKQATRQLKKNRYQSAADILQPKMATISGMQKDVAALTLGLVYLKTAVLYRELYRSSLMVNADYLKRLSKVTAKNRSQAVDYYMADILLQMGRPVEAQKALERFLAAEFPEQALNELAKLLQGQCYFVQGDTTRAEKIWQGADTNLVEVLAELAAIFSRQQRGDASQMIDQALTRFHSAGKRASFRIVTNAIEVYANTGQIEKGMQLLQKSDLKAFSFEEIFGQNKSVRFYDAALLGNLSFLLGRASIAHFKNIPTQAPSYPAAQYYLGEALALVGDYNQSRMLTGMFLASPQAPAVFKSKAQIRLASLDYRQGLQVKAEEALLQAAANNSPDILADVLFTCAQQNMACNEFVTRAALVAKAGQGKRFAPLNYALGKYYLNSNDNKRAVAYMETARDKSNKSKIEFNSPLMLIDLAQAYYRTVQFAEALEIYFEISKQFPAVRQIQDAMQGIYSMEQKSAGDVKIN
ncbi:MAG: tetratricopeptide repeat protein [Desulfobacterales bacterium]|nr:tetratricopeptide repeat protein [Desulfobacterales bacterium]